MRWKNNNIVGLYIVDLHIISSFFFFFTLLGFKDFKRWPKHNMKKELAPNFSLT